MEDKYIIEVRRQHPNRKLPILKKGMIVNHDALGRGEVLKNEFSGCCLIDFEGKKRKIGIRSLHMGLAYHSMKVENDNCNNS
jgi:hypothetical protein